MSNANNFSEIFEGNFDEIQGKIKQYFGKLTDSDIKKLEGTYDEFVGKVKKAYGYTEKQLEEEINHFFESEGFEAVKSRAKQLLSNAADYAECVKDGIQHSAENIRQKSSEVQDTLISYTKKNPLKSIGIALFTGLMLGKIL
ncbi:MAG: CsbD family protein [Gammaproteobacteria bacterium]|nr:CsbD family protein [Gammaproteobacteria bacterium]